jgi:hypothetical protein
MPVFLNTLGSSPLRNRISYQILHPDPVLIFAYGLLFPPPDLSKCGHDGLLIDKGQKHPQYLCTSQRTADPYAYSSLAAVDQMTVNFPLWSIGSTHRFKTYSCPRMVITRESSPVRPRVFTDILLFGTVFGFHDWNQFFLIRITNSIILLNSYNGY